MLITAANSQRNVPLIQAALYAVVSLHLTTVKYPSQTCVFDGQSYDYIVIGGGTAGIVVATRLAEDKTVTVLLIEAGGDPELESNIVSLMLYGKSDKSAWQYKIQDFGVARETHTDSNDDMSLGKVLGGSSSNNFLWYTAGHKDDYNYWAKNVSDSTWEWKNVLPYFKKSQKFNDPEVRKTDGQYFGKNGNIGLSVIRSAGVISQKPYFNMFKEAGNPIVPDVSGHVHLGYASSIFNILNNLRQSTANSYLAPKASSSNLYVLKNAIVKKIIFDACKNAVGVEVHIEDCGKRHVYIKAKIEVILSAGVVNSPKILMLSGIGRKKQLSQHKIHTIADLPVGEGLQDNAGVVLVANMSKVIIPSRPFDPRSYPATVIMGYASRTKKGEHKSYPDYQSVNYINMPKLLMNYCTHTYGIIELICNYLIETALNTQMMFIVINKQNWKSRGNITLKSNDYRDKPIIYSGYYNNQQDLEDQALNLKHYLKIVKTETFKKLGGKIKDPKLGKCGKFDANNLKYLTCYAKYMLISSHLYGGTCVMGGVVNSHLQVYHVNRLRVVDASVMPSVTAGGTMGSTVMIAEKAADMIKKDRKRRKMCYSH